MFSHQVGENYAEICDSHYHNMVVVGNYNSSHKHSSHVQQDDGGLCSVVSDEGIYVIGFSYPVVPKDKARIRVQISACHTAQQIDKAVDAFIKIGRRLKVIT